MKGKASGSRVLVLAAGHYPLIDHARAAACTFHQQRKKGVRHEKQSVPWVFTGYELVRDAIPDAGDHGGFWETSLMLALNPDLVDLSVLPKDPNEPLLSVRSNRPVQESNAEFGEKALDLIVQRVTTETKARLSKPGGLSREWFAALKGSKWFFPHRGENRNETNHHSILRWEAVPMSKISRRGFLGTSTTAALGAAVTSVSARGQDSERRVGERKDPGGIDWLRGTRSGRSHDTSETPRNRVCRGLRC